jgi:hypothetical protein
MRAQELGSGKLVIFDIDDTLVNTDTRVNVVQDGKVIKQLNSHDFTHYKLGPGESFDFGAFKDAREFFTKAKPIPGMIRQLKNDIATGNRVIMLTARSDFNDRDVFLDTFRRFGIDMDQVHVYRAGNLAIKAATEEKKKIILKHLLGKEHFDKLIMYDDSVPNLNAFLSLKQDYPWSKFYAWHVDPNGQATEYSRAINELNYPDELNVSDALQQYFVRRGYQVAGEGRDQIAFESPRGTVVKVLGIGDHEREKIVKDYVAFFIRNQRNPYYPRIYNTGNFTVGDETYFVYEQEYLNYVADEEEVLEYIEDLMSALPRGEQALYAFQQNRPMPRSLDPGEIDGLVMATQDLEDHIGGAAPLDLSMIENIRRRKDGHLVIMDPYSL